MKQFKLEHMGMVHVVGPYNYNERGEVIGTIETIEEAFKGYEVPGFWQKAIKENSYEEIDMSKDVDAEKKRQKKINNAYKFLKKIDLKKDVTEKNDLKILNI